MTRLLAPLPATAAIGPVFVKAEKREHYTHELSETCALTDRVYQDKSSKVNLGFADYVHPTPHAVAALPKPEEVIEKYKDMVREHVERKILFFFQQMIVCYKTKLHFEAMGAQDQAQSAPGLQVKVKGAVVQLAKRNAAHSGVLPCLVAYDEAEWEAHQAGGAKPTGFTFLQGTDYYRNANATMNMPRWMNEADRETEEKTKASLLRQKALALINRIAQGEITPDEGIDLFIETALFEIRAAKARLAKAKKDPEVQKVLCFYEAYFLEFKVSVKDPEFLKNFLNIKIDQDASKQVVLKLRYGWIREAQTAQAGLIQKADKVRKEILGTFAKKPNYYETAFRSLLVDQARTNEDRLRLARLYNFSPHHMLRWTAARKTALDKTKTALAPHVQKITNLARDLLQDMRHLRTVEEQQRAQVVKELRAMKKWTQKTLGAHVKARFPNAAASQPTICRIENCIKRVTPPIATELSQVFDVDAGLFMPHFFYD